MTTTTTVAVTGTTGRLGQRVAERLVADGMALRLPARRPEAVPSWPGCEVVVASYDDTESSTRALDGVETLFMVSGAEAQDRVSQHRTFIDAAVAAGVGHIVYTSFFAAAADATFTLGRDHWATEEHLRSSGVRWTFLRDNLYLDFLPMLAGEDGAIRGPAGDGRVSAVATDDVADVAAAVLRDPTAHFDVTYGLTGPEALSLQEVADRTGATYVDETIEEAYASRASYGAPDWQVDAWVSTYLAIKSGELAAVTGDVERVAGHPPRSLAELL